jgi:hypothetical protein
MQQDLQLKHFKSEFLATSANCGKRAILPSSFMISTITPADLKPANRAKSIAASV